VSAGTGPTAGELASWLEEHGIEAVRLVVLDLHGVPRAKLVSAAHFPRVADRGHPWALPLLAVDIWQGLAPEEREMGVDTGYGNGVARPDLASLRLLPWTRGTAHVMADVFTRAGDAAPTPRQALRRVLADAEATGHRPVLGTELEFYLYRPDPEWQGFRPAFGLQSWFSEHALALSQEFLEDLHACVDRIGLPVYEVFNEHGGGQFEINLAPGSGLGAVDDVVLLKVAIKEVAMRHGLRATFLAKPANGGSTPPSGYHLHQALHSLEGDNAFRDPDSPDGLSALARAYVGGHLAHAAGMTGVAAPTVTAYKRYVPGTWAPVRAAWAIDNRTALVRAIPGGPDGADTRVENRLGSSDANPYLLAAVMVAAGLDGVRRGLDPGPPATANVLEDERYPELPATLIEGVEAFAADTVLGEALGVELSRTFARCLRNDWSRFHDHVTDWEIREYRDLL
jgi:glutamine synthetase